VPPLFAGSWNGASGGLSWKAGGIKMAAVGMDSGRYFAFGYAL